MTDMKPGSQWLLPVRFEDYAVPKVGRYILPNGMDVLLTGGDLAGIIPADRITELEAEVARLRGDLAYERSANGREAERIFVASLLADEIEVLTNSPSSFDVQDGIALTAFQKRLIGLWRVRDSLPAPSEKEAG